MASCEKLERNVSINESKTEHYFSYQVSWDDSRARLYVLKKKKSSITDGTSYNSFYKDKNSLFLEITAHRC